MIKNQRYTARDVISIRQEIIQFIKDNSDKWTDFSESDIGMMFIEILAGVSDMLNYYLDSQARETFLMSAKQRRNVRGLAETLNYKLPSIGSARGSLFITLHNPFGGDDSEFTSTVTIPKYTRICNEDSNLTPYVLAHEAVLNGCGTVEVDIIQGDKQLIELKKSELIDSVGDTYRFYLGDSSDIPLDCVYIRQENVYWEQVNDAFLEIDGGMKFSVHADENDKTYIMFTYNYTEFLPSDSDVNIEIMYLKSLGTGGVAPALSLVKFVDNVYYTGLDITQALFITNPAKTHSAYDSIDLNLLKAKARKNLLTMDRLITLEDYKNFLDAKPYILHSKVADWNSDVDLVSSPYLIKCWFVASDASYTTEAQLEALVTEMKSKGCAMQKVFCYNAKLVDIGIKAHIYVRGVGDYRETVRKQALEGLNAYTDIKNMSFGQVISSKYLKDMIRDLSKDILDVEIEYDAPSEYLSQELNSPTSFITLGKIEFPNFTSIDVALKGSEYGTKETI